MVAVSVRLVPSALALRVRVRVSPRAGPSRRLTIQTLRARDYFRSAHLHNNEPLQARAVRSRRSRETLIGRGLPLVVGVGVACLGLKTQRGVANSGEKNSKARRKIFPKDKKSET